MHVRSEYRRGDVPWRLTHPPPVYSGFKFSQLEMSTLPTFSSPSHPRFSLTVVLCRGHPRDPRVDVRVLALPGQADLLEFRGHHVPGHGPRVVQARDDPSSPSRVPLNSQIGKLFDTIILRTTFVVLSFGSLYVADNVMMFLSFSPVATVGTSTESMVMIFTLINPSRGTPRWLEPVGTVAGASRERN